MVPAWLHILAIVSLAAGLACAAFIAWDQTRHPQHMWIMYLVWPLCALFGSVLALWAYLRIGRMQAHGDHQKPPFPASVAKGALHCGAGCTLGDIVAEWLAFAVPAVAVWAGWQSLFAEKMFAVWIVDYLFALAFGVAFQYFSIKPMRDLSVGQGLVAALKADVLSLTAWQVGMYGFMAIAQFLLFRGLLGVRLEVASVEFWFMMQIAMLAGFATSYPVNWWLLRRGIKERM
ncbi:DUF4396 domain-containing protein [Coralloluteibacterium stylophorae]|nr:DUF4396 domain-containing protein [Coralloluteibacterium stylophorae]